MTVNTTSITSGPYTGNDVADEFSYGFRVETKDQLLVYETDLDETITILTVDVDYTVGDIGDDLGGIITRVAGPLPTGYEWYIRSNYQATQGTAFDSQGGFFPNIHENAIDKLTFLIQQSLEELSRSVKVPVTSDTNPDDLIEEIRQAAIDTTANADVTNVDDLYHRDWIL